MGEMELETLRKQRLRQLYNRTLEDMWPLYAEDDPHWHEVYLAVLTQVDEILSNG